MVTTPGDPRPAPLARLLTLLLGRITDELLARLRAAGFDDVRPAHNAVFAHVPREGIRLTELAERAGLTKQAMSQLVADLEYLGYLRRRPDPTDGRASLIEFTDTGWTAVEVALDTFDAIERELAEQVGDNRMRGLRRTLELLADEEPAAASTRR